MKKIKCKILTSDSTDKFIERLKSVTIEKQPFVKPKGILFLGNIKGDSFRLITFNSPPMKFDFKISENQIDLEYQKDDLTKTLKGLIFAFLLPVFVGLWIWGILDNNVEITSKILLTLFLLIPFGISKLTKFLYQRFILVNDDKFITTLENRLNIIIEKSTATNTASK